MHNIVVCRQVRGAGRLHLLRDGRDRAGEGVRQPAHRVPLVLLLLLSPLPPPSHPCCFFFFLFLRCLTPTPEMRHLFLHMLHAVFSACKQTSKVHYRNCGACARCAALPLTASSRRPRLIGVTLTSQCLPQQLSITSPTLLTLEAKWHPAGTVTNPPPHVLSWLLSSHIALAEPLPRLLPRGTLLDNLTFIQETEQKLPFPFSLFGKLLFSPPFIPCSGS